VITEFLKEEEITMRKYMLILALTFLVMLSLRTNTMAQGDETWIEISIEKIKESSSEHYNFCFDFDGIPGNMDNVDRFLLKIPNGNKMVWKNSLLVDDYVLGAENMTFSELQSKFPEGRYRVVFIPKTLGKLKVNVTHDFPQTPVITNPVDGATNVPLNPTIVWNSISGIMELTLEIEDEFDDALLELPLPTSATSFLIPSGLLQPNTQYELSLKAHKLVDSDPYPGPVRIVGGMNIELISSQTIYFTTGN
jgi:hypothetical protein